jgi:cytosine/adenosine deaminase-related metal-dependent hydrolase
MIIRGASVTVEDGKIVDVGSSDAPVDFQIQLDTDDLLFPAMINSHDHLFGNYYPRIGSGPYLNWLAWDNDLKSCELYRERSHIANIDLYLLGSYRNLISGVATVSDHIPHSVNSEFIPKMPMTVMKDYTLEHECSSFDLKWGRGISVEHAEAVKKDIPFITHIEEGFDEESMLGIDILDELKALDEYTVLIHGIGFSKQDIETIARRKANVVWCPSSNYYMFQLTTDIKGLLDAGVSVSLGTDSPMSGGLNIFEEMQFARTLYRKIYNEDLPYRTIVEMVTTRAAKNLRLRNEGKVEKNFKANLLVIRNGDVNDPYKSLVHSWFNSVKLVIIDGVPVYGDHTYEHVMRHFDRHYQAISINGLERILVGKPHDLYSRIWENVRFKKVLPFFPIDFY